MVITKNLFFRSFFKKVKSQLKVADFVKKMGVYGKFNKMLQTLREEMKFIRREWNANQNHLKCSNKFKC